MISEVFNCDCMEYMKTVPDKFFDLAFPDPPYGSKVAAFGGRFEKYEIERTGGAWAKKYKAKIKDWDVAPGEDYFKELFRISKNQIIWGGNYFHLPPTRCFVIWRKLTISEKFSMAMCEYAWASFNKNAKWFEYPPQEPDRFHPTQKPVPLYKWLLQNYAKPGDKIFDSHMGSQSSRIACHQMGFDFWGCEIDPEYFRDGCIRFEKASEQGMLFTQEVLF